MKTRKPVLEDSRYASAEASPGYLFWKAFYTWQRKIRSQLDVLKITQSQYAILATLSYLASEKTDVSQQDLANQLSMDKMMVSDVVKTLERKSLIVREDHLTDGRAFALKLTPRAKKLVKKATPVVEGVDEAFFGVLHESLRRDFLKALTQLHQ